MLTTNTHINSKKNKLLSKEDYAAFIEADETPRKMTVEQLRKHKEFSDISIEEAENIIDTLHKLSILAYFYYVELGNDK